MTLRIGSLFSGYGGLDDGVRRAVGGTVAWVSDIDPGACKILAHHHPDTPNLGDITGIDWSTVEPVDVLTGGFPCQDVSTAGRRAGIRPGTRSGLWEHFAYAIDQLRPRLVVIENVRGLLSATAHSDVEPCPLCVGDDTDGALRALGAVLGDLADLGYDAVWHGIRASDIGAPHGRFRVFIVAYPAGGRWRVSNRDGGAPTDPDSAGHQRSRVSWDGRPGPTDGLFPTPRATDGTHGGLNQRGSSGDLILPSAVAQLLPTPCAVDGRFTGQPAEERERAGRQFRLCDATEANTDRWGDYAPAIARWETLTRPAPDPTEPSPRDGISRLAPRFVEWMMGLDEGHVTDTPGLTRKAQLKALGNGVVPQQAEAATRWALDVMRGAA